MCDQRLSALRAGDKFPKGGTYFLGNLARAGDIFGGDILAVIPETQIRIRTRTQTFRNFKMFKQGNLV